MVLYNNIVWGNVSNQNNELTGIHRNSAIISWCYIFYLVKKIYFKKAVTNKNNFKFHNIIYILKAGIKIVPEQNFRSPTYIRGVIKILYLILFYQIHLVAVPSYLASQKNHHNLICLLLYHCLKHLWMSTNVICNISFTATTPSKILFSTILSFGGTKKGGGKEGLDLGRSVTVTQCLATNLRTDKAEKAGTLLWLANQFQCTYSTECLCPTTDTQYHKRLRIMS